MTLYKKSIVNIIYFDVIVSNNDYDQDNVFIVKSRPAMVFVLLPPRGIIPVLTNSSSWTPLVDNSVY